MTSAVLENRALEIHLSNVKEAFETFSACLNMAVLVALPAICSAAFLAR